MPMRDMPPLVVDLDGTLTKTDTLVESIIQLGKQHPLDLLKLPFWLIEGRAYFKERIANRATLSVQNLPYRTVLIDYLKSEKQQGRKIVLATAANHRIANAVAEYHVDLFDFVLASDERCNLKGTEKLTAIQEKVGKEFVYAGDNKADLPIWASAKAAILVNTSTDISNTVQKNTPIELEISSENASFKVWVRALRVHQWFKNLLLFVPLLTAFSFQEIDKLFAITLAFLAFSLAASGTYIANDLWDLDSDRVHPRKKYRPFASADIPILNGIAFGLGLLTLGFALAINVSLNFFWMLLLYLFVTTSYSWMLKTYVLIDVIVLSLLYTLRIIAGSIAVSVSVSSWLLAFSVFIFFSLALVKRCAELMTLSQRGLESTHGRDYRATDLVVLWPLGVGSALSAVVVFGLFISDAETQLRYATPQGLWIVAIALIYWLARLWIKTARGEMHDDPLVFAMKDFGSRMTILFMIATTLAVHFLHWK
jgi:HAD superfamily hydrolase (TIGR01549 family)